MAPEHTKTPRRRPVCQNIIPYDLNELRFSTTYAEAPKVKRRRRTRRPMTVSQDGEPERDHSQSSVLPYEHKRSESPLFPVEEPDDEALPFSFEQIEYSTSPLLPPEENEGEINTTAWERCDEIMAETRDPLSPEPEGAVVLDPEHSERQHYREPLTGFQREVWRPGDGDGSQSTDYYQRAGPVLPMDQRWRLFQSNLGPIGLGKSKTEPPRFVFLDDRAAHEVLTSDIQRARLTREWPHDFAANGRIRARRTHCGRPAIKDPLVPEYHTTPITKTANYTFTGEKDYKPVFYRLLPAEPSEPSVEALDRKRKIEEAKDPLMYNPRGHGHNQYTPKDIMVKHGAASFGRKKPREEENEMLAKLKSLAPNAMVKDKLIPRASFGDGSSRAGSRRSRSKTVASGMSSLPMKATAAPEADDAMPATQAEYGVPEYGLPTSAENNQDKEDDSDSDMEFFPKPAQPSRPISTPTPTAASALTIPRQMGYIERRVREQALAKELMNAVQNQDDVVRITNELAEANVAIADQAREIERLTRSLEQTQAAVRDLQGVLDDMQGDGDDGSMT